MWKVANAVECKAPPHSSSMKSCIAVPGNRMPYFLHSRQRAEHREALEGRSQESSETNRWSNPWKTQATHSTVNERRVGQPSPWLRTSSRFPHLMTPSLDRKSVVWGKIE